MATINIGAENAADPHYRYKMPKPISKVPVVAAAEDMKRGTAVQVEGRGNGIKTNVVNNVDIAKALERPPEYILKFLGCELGAQTNFDSKTGTSIVNGAHDANVLMTLIEAFIKKYVQCYSCRNPETVVSVRREKIYLKCKACGHVSEVDMHHKLNNYILRNPPSSGLSKEEKQLRKQEKERLKALKSEKEEKKKERKKEKEEEKLRKKKGKNSSVDADAETDGKVAKPEESEPTAESTPIAKEKEKEKEEEVVWHSETSAEAIAQRAKEQISSSAVASLVTQGNIEAEASEAKKKLRKLMTKLEFADETIAAVNELGKRLYKDASDSEVVDFLTETLPKAPVRMLVLYLVLFWEASQKLGSIVKDKCALLKKCAVTPADQLAQLFGLEYVVAMMMVDRLKEYPQILKVLYDEDVIDEEIIVGWYERPAACQKTLGVTNEKLVEVRKKCEAFMEWLQEESDEEDEDEEEE